MKKRLFSIFLTLVLCVGLCAALSVSVFAARYDITLPCELDFVDNMDPHIYFTPEESGYYTLRATSGADVYFNFDLCNLTTNPRGYQVQTGGYGDATINAYLPAGHNFELIVWFYAYDAEPFHISIFPKIDEHTHRKDDNAYHAAVEPTCASVGRVEFWDCMTPHCDVKLDADGNIIENAVIPTEKHVDEEFILMNPATCGAPGEAIDRCTVCGRYTERVIPPTDNHSFGSYSVTTPPTCGEPGVETAYCTVCGATFTLQIRPTGEHSPGEYSLTTPATCSAPGIETAYCTVCGKAVTRETSTDPNAHTFSTEWSHDDNYHWHAAACGHDVTTNFGGHDWVSTRGWLWTTSKCSVCGAQKGYGIGSTLSQGNGVIVGVIAAAAVVAVGAIVIVKKKKSEE